MQKQKICTTVFYNSKKIVQRQFAILKNLFTTIIFYGIYRVIEKKSSKKFAQP